MTKRSFFKALATLALAPQIAFKVQPRYDLYQIDNVGPWELVPFADLQAESERQAALGLRWKTYPEAAGIAWEDNPSRKARTRLSLLRSLVYE